MYALAPDRGCETLSALLCRSAGEELVWQSAVHSLRLAGLLLDQLATNARDLQTSSESWFLDLTDPEGRVRLVQKRKQNVLYHPCELVALVSLSVLPSVKVGELFHVRELPNWLG